MVSTRHLEVTLNYLGEILMTLKRRNSRVVAPWISRAAVLSLIISSLTMSGTDAVSARTIPLSGVSRGSSSTGAGTLTGAGQVKMSLSLDAKRSCSVKPVKRYGQYEITVYFKYPNSTTGTYEPNVVYTASKSGISNVASSTFVYAKSSTGPVQQMYFWLASSGRLDLKSNWTGSFQMKLAPQPVNPGAARSDETIKGSWSCP